VARGGMTNHLRIADMLTCARREVAIREVVYPKRVAQGRMKLNDAEREILLMKAIVQHFEAELTHG
jgi:hypothetical protein